jgi:hypothetical protein
VEPGIAEEDLDYTPGSRVAGKDVADVLTYAGEHDYLLSSRHLSNPQETIPALVFFY